MPGPPSQAPTSPALDHTPSRWLWVVSATCLLALGAGAAIGYSLTRDTHVGRGDRGNAHVTITDPEAEVEGFDQTFA